MVHLEAVLVSDGGQVAPGTVLGLEGSTGFSTGLICTSRSIGVPGDDLLGRSGGLISLPAGA
jgi:hypothetical protein